MSGVPPPPDPDPPPPPDPVSHAMTEPPSPIDQDSAPQQPALVQPIHGDGTGTAAVTAPVRTHRGSMIDPFGLRTLIISWCLWLLVSWSITLAIDATVHAVRWVIFSAAFGLMAVWPALRLSQQLPWYHPYERGGTGLNGGAGRSRSSRAGTSTRVLATLLDWVCLLAVFQVVVWPLMLVGRWTVQQTLWLDLAVMSWSLLAGAFVGLGRVLPTAWARISAMGLCVLLAVGEPVWMALSGSGFAKQNQHGQDWQMRISPIQALWELTTTGQPYDPAGWVPAIISTAVAAGLAWVMLGVMALVIRKT